MTDYDVIILGGGAAGLMCAIAAGQRGQRVLVLEGSNRIGKKILMSGGGRCNFTNLHCAPQNFLSANPHFCKSALSRYTQWDFIALVEKHGIAYHEKTLGQLFCNSSSKDILAALQAECDACAVDIRTSAGIDHVYYNGSYHVSSSKGAFSAPSLVLATGGLSIPKMGATDFGYRLARQFGLQVNDTRAALVPLTFTGALLDICERLSGVSLPATVTCENTTFRESLLFTHRGMSGPAILQISSYWSPGQTIHINLLPDQSAADLVCKAKAEKPRSTLRTVIAGLLPRAVVTELSKLLWPDYADHPLTEIPDAFLRNLGDTLNCWEVKPAATEGYRTAEVTLGGIDTGELSSQTMESKRQPRLYCIGEVVDVTGHLGGFNFQWAWASGQAAGQRA